MELLYCRQHKLSWLTDYASTSLSSLCMWQNTTAATTTLTHIVSKMSAMFHKLLEILSLGSIVFRLIILRFILISLKVVAYLSLDAWCKHFIGWFLSFSLWIMDSMSSFTSSSESSKHADQNKLISSKDQVVVRTTICINEQDWIGWSCFRNNLI